MKRAVETSEAHLMMQTYARESLRQLRQELVNVARIVKINKQEFLQKVSEERGYVSEDAQPNETLLDEQLGQRVGLARLETRSSSSLTDPPSF